jgi:hypothetical protein
MEVSNPWGYAQIIQIIDHDLVQVNNLLILLWILWPKKSKKLLASLLRWTMGLTG